MSDINRRKFITFLGAGATVIPVSALVGSLPSRADDLPLVDPESSTAQTYEYVEVTEVAGSMCSNCALYTGDEGSESGLCPLFAGSAVMASGWCKAYVPRT